jgi:hypothetical protein
VDSNRASSVLTTTMPAITEVNSSMRRHNSSSVACKYTVPTRSPSSTIGRTTTTVRLVKCAPSLPGVDGVASVFGRGRYVANTRPPRSYTDPLSTDGSASSAPSTSRATVLSPNARAAVQLRPMMSATVVSFCASARRKVMTS